MDEKELDAKIKKHCTEMVGLKEERELAECMEYTKQLLISTGIEHKDWEQTLLQLRAEKKAGVKKGGRTKKRTRKGRRRRKTRKY
jgi:predicted house-cleaning noncanonical NTP pyrophosphatase (MazG superfamily)